MYKRQTFEIPDGASVLVMQGRKVMKANEDGTYTLENGTYTSVSYTHLDVYKRQVKDNGDTVLQNRGILNDREIRKIQAFIKQNYQEMYLKWSEYSQEGYYEKDN